DPHTWQHLSAKEKLGGKVDQVKEKMGFDDAPGMKDLKDLKQKFGVDNLKDVKDPAHLKEVDALKDRLKKDHGIDNPKYLENLERLDKPKIVSVDKDSDLKLTDKASALRQDQQLNLSPGDREKPFHDLMGISREDLEKKGLTNGRVGDMIDLQGSGSYNHQSEILFLDPKIHHGPDARNPAEVLGHEMGHLKQDKLHGNHGGNTQNTILEYDNVLKNENLLNKDPRHDYTHDRVPGDHLRENTRTWNDVEKDLDHLPPEQQANSKKVFNELKETLEDPRYADKADQIKKNFADEYFSSRRKDAERAELEAKQEAE
ncbi:hypothetical protein ACFXPA_12750, partial [Amycolatopsis sp. NPDC059090]|uniref:hypothetical protein n=1 Tax=Amycolatopsis sp. NPDC059090 TaxID=3346723 RepID=UPI00366FF97E